MEYTILIADDDAELVRILKTFFELRKYRVITARNGTEALKMAENDLGFQLTYENRDEMGQLCREFDRMRE